MSRSLSRGQRLALRCVGAYRVLVKPLLPAACRFEPSCSQYAVEAIGSHGAWRGLGLALRRLLRCRPGGGGGADPVPPPPERRAAQRGMPN